MISVIGLGKLGGKIADKFSAYPQYEVYKIGHDLPKGKKNKEFPKQETPEKYEEKCPKLGTFFKDVSDEVLIICDGSEYIASSSLRVLEQLSGKSLKVMYLKPELTLLDQGRKKHERMVFNVFQQFARSGLLDMVYLVDMEKLEESAGELPIENYYDNLYEFLVYTFHMINVFSRTDGLINNFQPIDRVNRIAAFGVSNLENEDRMFFSLDNAFDIGYYYGVSKKTLENDKKLLPRIKKNMKAKSDEFTRAMFSIHETKNEQNVVFCVKYTKLIQGESDGKTQNP